MGSDKKNKKNEKYFYFCPWLLRFKWYNILEKKKGVIKDENKRNKRIKNGIL